MVKESDIKWSKYSIYEGPFFHGTAGYKLPANPDKSDLIMRVITATEGGRWNAINMYDRCILTVGLIQWCEGGQYSVSDMLAVTLARNVSDVAKLPMRLLMEENGIEFRRNARGRQRFHFADERGEVDRTEEQQQLFLLHSDGKQGSWDDASKAYAKRWAAAFATLYEDTEAIKAQRDYTVPRLMGFALPYARDWLDRAPNSDLGAAFVCAFLSFAANNPKHANNHLKLAVEASKVTPYSLNWLVDVLRQLTFGPKISIYPKRYDAIRPVLE